MLKAKNILQKSNNKYLIIGPSWVGDMVMAQSLFAQLKADDKDCMIDVLAPAWTAALLDRMPQVNQLIEAGFEHGKLGLSERWQLSKKLRVNGYTQAIVLPNSLKSALLPWVARIPKRTGFIGEQRWGLLNDIRRLDKKKWPMTVQRFVALGLDKSADCISLSQVIKPVLQVKKGNIQTTLKTLKLKHSKQPLLVLCPGAEFGNSKQWPAQYYAEVAKYYLQQKWQVWLMGSENDAVTCKQLNQLADNQCQNLAGVTTLPQAIDLMSLSNLVVANDSGLMHIAAALQKPLVAVYGSTDPGFTPPLNVQVKIARLGLECSPCFRRECPLQHLDCLNKLMPDYVLKACDKVMNI